MRWKLLLAAVLVTGTIVAIALPWQGEKPRRATSSLADIIPADVYFHSVHKQDSPEKWKRNCVFEEMLFALDRLSPTDTCEAAQTLVADLAFNHPSEILRCSARIKFFEFQEKRKSTGNDDWNAGIETVEAERNSRLKDLVSRLERGEYESLRKKIVLVCNTFQDSYNQENVALAIRAVNLYVDEEQSRKIVARDEGSVFYTLLDKGLLNTTYCCSWGQRSRPEWRDEVASLAMVLQRFGPEAATITVKRLAESIGDSGREIPRETAQLLAIFDMFGEHRFVAVEDLLAILASRINVIDQSRIVERICREVQRDPHGVEALLEKSSLHPSSAAYREIRVSVQEAT